MATAQETLDQQYLEMRWRILSLAADLDRIQRAGGGADVIRADPRLAKLRQGVQFLLSDELGRAERFESLLSDHTPPPSRGGR